MKEFTRTSKVDIYLSDSCTKRIRENDVKKSHIDPNLIAPRDVTVLLSVLSSLYSFYLLILQGPM